MLTRQPQLDLIAQGTFEEIGYQQGVMLRKQIRHCADVVARLEAFRLRQPAWMPYRWFHRFVERKAYRLLKQNVASRSEPHWQRLSGIAHGSRLSIRTICLLNAMESILSNLTRSTAHGAAAACSAVAFGPRQTTIAGPILAHNFDYLPLIQPFYVLRDEQPDEGLRSIQFSVAPLAGAIDGMNEAGLALTYDYAYSTNQPAEAPLISMQIGETLSRCRNVDEAVDHLTARPSWGNGLIMLADAQGTIAAVERAQTSHGLRRPTGRQVLFHSNQFCCPTTRQGQLSPEATYNEKAPQALRGRRVLQSSERRDARLQELTSQEDPFSPADITRIMADHGSDNRPSPDTICMHGGYWQTTASLQFFPGQRTIRIAYGPACQSDYVQFSL